MYKSDKGGHSQAGTRLLLIVYSFPMSNSLWDIYIYIYMSTAMQKPVLWYILGRILFTYLQHPYTLMYVQI